MHAAIVYGCLALVAGGCARGGSLDEVAAEYVRLARVEGSHDAAYIAAVARATEAASALDERDGRRAFLLAQLEAMGRRARFLAGERTTIEQDATALGLPVPAFDHERAAVLRAQLDAALPGPGRLLERLAAHRRAQAVPRSQLDRAAHAAVDRCRSRTPVPAGIHDPGVELRYVVDSPWPAFTSRGGGGTSAVAVRRDVAWLEDDLLTVLCHETYPGHHLQNLVWDELQSTRGWQEFSVVPPFTPLAVMAERAANAAALLAVPRAERSALSRTLDDLAPLALATAIDMLDGHLDRQAGMARLRDDLLMPDAEGFLRFVEEYRGMAVAYVTPLEGIEDWNAYFALLRSPGRMVGDAAPGRANGRSR